MKSLLYCCILALTLTSYGFAKAPNGVYEYISENKGMRSIDRWDFREDGTVLSSKSLIYNGETVLSPPATLNYWRAAWIGKEIYFRYQKDSEEEIHIFTRDGNDLIGTGKGTTLSARYLKKG